MSPYIEKENRIATAELIMEASNNLPVERENNFPTTEELATFLNTKYTFLNDPFRTFRKLQKSILEVGKRLQEHKDAGHEHIFNRTIAMGNHVRRLSKIPKNQSDAFKSIKHDAQSLGRKAVKVSLLSATALATTAITVAGIGLYSKINQAQDMDEILEANNAIGEAATSCLNEEVQSVYPNATLDFIAAHDRWYYERYNDPDPTVQHVASQMLGSVHQGTELSDYYQQKLEDPDFAKRVRDTAFAQQLGDLVLLRDRDWTEINSVTIDPEARNVNYSITNVVSDTPIIQSHSIRNNLYKISTSLGNLFTSISRSGLRSHSSGDYGRDGFSQHTKTPNSSEAQQAHQEQKQLYGALRQCMALRR